ncbi:MAG: hypothetical protein ABIT20_00510 [Gemmatimonadaceae bacterium]
MLNPDVAVPLAAVIATVVLLAAGWTRHRERMAALRSTNTASPAVLPADVETRLARLEQSIAALPALEQSVDAIALEIERIGEGQRFLTRLLSEVPPKAGRVDARPAEVIHDPARDAQ